MAIWQFDFFIVPREGFMPWRSDDGYEVPPLPESLAQLANTLLTQKLGNSCLLFGDRWIFGEEQGNRVDLSLGETGGAELSARIDVRADAQAFCQIICGVAAQLGCIFFAPESAKVIQPEVAALMSELKNSRAFTFIGDPHGFLGRVQNENDA